jgi:hypothetical protein
VAGPAGATGPTGTTAVVELTQAAYDALGTKDPNTLYVITDSTAGGGGGPGPTGPTGPAGAAGPTGPTGPAGANPVGAVVLDQGATIDDQASGEFRIWPKDGGWVNFHGALVGGASDPSNPQDLATKGYVDSKPMMQVVNHGFANNVARPAGAAAVYWIGTVAPIYAATYDLWVNA